VVLSAENRKGYRLVLPPAMEKSLTTLQTLLSGAATAAPFGDATLLYGTS